MKKLLYIFLLFPVFMLGQSQGQNYVKTMAYKVPTTAPISEPEALEARVDITYFDGLGRPIQQVAHRQSADGMDIITPIVYDSFGRQVRQYLPYPTEDSSMDFVNTGTAITGLEAYYYNKYGTPGNNPYSEKLLEASPLNRVMAQSAPGEVWNDSAHSIKFEYTTNSGSDTPGKVKLYTATATWNAALGYYGEVLGNTTGTVYHPEGTLYCTVTKDENWASGNEHTTREYKNFKGQVVLKRTFNNAVAHDTYYVYDQFGSLAFVVPPLAGGTIDAATLDGLCYRYRYDKRNRLVEKKLPGRDLWEFMVYDKLDRLVASGPSVSPFTDLQGTGWVITKYDAFNRPILTGWIEKDDPQASATRKALQDDMNVQATYFSESRAGQEITINGIGMDYTSEVWPQEDYHVLTVNYYDNYSYPGGPTGFEGAVYYNETNLPQGLATGSWVRVLEASTDYRGELSYNLYDDKGRVVESKTINHLGGYTQTINTLDFSGKVLSTQTRHKRLDSDTELVINEEHTYTGQDRPLAHSHRINNQNIEGLSISQYDALGQLQAKKVGGPAGGDYYQKVDYSYNIRGWLTGINDVQDLTDPDGSHDLFAFGLSYDTTRGDTIPGVEPLYNGNISETYWRSASDDVLRKYSYEYDGLNRLTYSTYQRPGATVPVTGSYNEGIGYDANGNITALMRNGGIDDSQTIMIDNLYYYYGDKSNRLMKVFDDRASSQGFRDDSDGMVDPDDDYDYDGYGNMTADANKEIIEIRYNHLNLPVFINSVFEEHSTIDYLYNALGKKVGKRVKISPNSGPYELVMTDYLGDFQYADGVLQFFPTAEGYVRFVPAGGSSRDYYFYVYNYTDHLGNIRLSYGQDPDDHIVKVLEENHYYPFGLKHENYNVSLYDYEKYGLGEQEVALAGVSAMQYKYKYNGKEFQDELGLNLYDYGARNYDAAIGRWMNIDPYAEKFKDLSPYNYCVNNPVYFIDPDGMQARYNWETGKYMDGDKEISFDEAIASYDAGTGDPPPTEAERLSEIVTIKGKQYHKNTSNVFASIGNTVNGWFGGDDDYFVEHKPYDKADESFMQEAVGQSAGFLAGGVVLKVGGKALGAVAGSTAGKAGVITVGRWMSKAEYAIMVKTGRMVEGAGGQTFVSTGGSEAWKAAVKGSVYAEFQVSAKSLLQGGQLNHLKAIGPTANKSMQSALQKQGGQVLPSVTNLTPILKVK